MKRKFLIVFSIPFLALSGAVMAGSTESAPSEWETLASPFDDVRVQGVICERSDKSGNRFFKREQLEAEAKRGVVPSMLLLGQLLADESPPDEQGAKMWFVRALATKDESALLYVSKLHFCGQLFPQDSAMGLSFLKQAAEAGGKSAAREIGNLYELGGPGLNPDPVQAREWYRKSDSIDYPRVLYLGIGGPKTPAAAFAWLKAKDEDSARKGVSIGWVKYNLALMYLRGDGTVKDQEAGRGLLRQVLSNSVGLQEATKKKARLLLQSADSKPL